MNHYARASFWDCYFALPEETQALANKNFALLKQDPQHPSLHFKRIGQLWSVRAGKGCRAPGLDDEVGIVWFWIGTHAEYDQLLKH